MCPGVRRLIGRLRRAGVRLGLVTGNFTRIGWKKVELAGLKRHFAMGVFGEMGKDRTALLKIAIRQARLHGWIQNGTRVSMIGDTPSDVLAARGNGVLAVAVSTGLCAREELLAFSPDVLVDDLLSLPLEALSGS